MMRVHNINLLHSKEHMLHKKLKSNITVQTHTITYYQIHITSIHILHRSLLLPRPSASIHSFHIHITSNTVLVIIKILTLNIISNCVCLKDTKCIQELHTTYYKSHTTEPLPKTTGLIIQSISLTM